MTMSRGTSSRAPRVRNASVARDTLTRRTKPYQTEQTRVLAPKKKLQLSTSTHGSAPPGFTFLPLGTAELAERCKELSRRKNFIVYTVNARNRPQISLDPGKLSHHVHRIGYHFRTEVIDDACNSLGYVVKNGQFFKEGDLASQSEAARIQRLYTRYGLKGAQVEHETEEQAKAAIQELFPRVPADDLDDIVRHAWMEGSGRVGTRKELALPHRVQLATLARIRHMYTDYDRLLAAGFPWAECRELVQKPCLQKLLEWRGENHEEGAEDEFEEVIRETIIIADEEDDDGNLVDDDTDDVQILRKTILIDDDESPTSRPPKKRPARGEGAYDSSSSMEISHMPISIDDLEPESHDERRPLKRYRARQAPRVQRRHMDLRQQIADLRKVINNPGHPAAQPIMRVDVPGGSQMNEMINIGGQLYRMEPAATATVSQRSENRPLPLLPQRRASGLHPSSGLRQELVHSRVSQQHSSQTDYAGGYLMRNQPVPSIEPSDDNYRPAVAYRQQTPDRERRDKRPRLEQPALFPKEASVRYRHSGPLIRPIAASHPDGPPEGGRLSAVELPHERFTRSFQHDGALLPGADRQGTMHDARNQPVLPSTVSSGHAHGGGPYQAERYTAAPQYAREVIDLTGAPNAPVQYLPYPSHMATQSRTDLWKTGQQHMLPQHVQGPERQVWVDSPSHSSHPLQRTMYVESPVSRDPYSVHGYQYPVHGAPAPVQQLPREFASGPPATHGLPVNHGPASQARSSSSPIYLYQRPEQPQPFYPR